MPLGASSVSMATTSTPMSVLHVPLIVSIASRRQCACSASRGTRLWEGHVFNVGRGASVVREEPASCVIPTMHSTPTSARSATSTWVGATSVRVHQYVRVVWMGTI